MPVDAQRLPLDVQRLSRGKSWKTAGVEAVRYAALSDQKIPYSGPFHEFCSQCKLKDDLLTCECKKSWDEEAHKVSISKSQCPIKPKVQNLNFIILGFGILFQVLQM